MDVHGEVVRNSESESVGTSSEALFQASAFRQDLPVAWERNDIPEAASSTSETVKTSNAAMIAILKSVTHVKLIGSIDLTLRLHNRSLIVICGVVVFKTVLYYLDDLIDILSINRLLLLHQAMATACAGDLEVFCSSLNKVCMLLIVHVPEVVVEDKMPQQIEGGIADIIFAILEECWRPLRYRA